MCEPNLIAEVEMVWAHQTVAMVWLTCIMLSRKIPYYHHYILEWLHNLKPVIICHDDAPGRVSICYVVASTINTRHCPIPISKISSYYAPSTNHNARNTTRTLLMGSVNKTTEVDLCVAFPGTPLSWFKGSSHIQLSSLPADYLPPLQHTVITSLTG